MEKTILIGRLVTVEDFANYLVEKEVSTVCPSCGHDDAFVSAESNGICAAQTRSDSVIFNMSTMGILPSVGETIIELSVVCDHCGYIRSFAAQNIYKWLDEKQSAKSST